MAQTEHYEVILIGRSAASLLCAALLARWKKRVLLLAPDAPPIALPPLPLVGLQTAPIVRRVLDELGLVHAVRSRLEDSRALVLAMPDRRARLEPELAARGQALGRAFPGMATPLLAFFGAIETFGRSLDPALTGDLPLPPEGFGDRRGLRRALAGGPIEAYLEGDLAPPRWPRDPELASLLASLLAALGRFERPSDAPIQLGTLRGLWHLCHGTFQLRDPLSELVAAKLAAYGGALDTRRLANRLEVRGRRIRSVSCSDGTVLGADVVVFGDGDRTLSWLLREDGASRQAPAAEARPEERLIRVGSLTLPGEDRPEALHDPCAWVPAPGAAGVIVRVHPTTLQLAWAPPPERPELERLVPFARIGELTWASSPQPTAGQIEPMGLFRRSIRCEPKNLFRTGPWVLPDLGLEGDCLSAWLTASCAARVGPRRRLLG